MTDLLVIYVAIKHNNSIINIHFTYIISLIHSRFGTNQFRYGCATDENVYFRLDIKLHKIGCVIKPELKKS